MANKDPRFSKMVDRTYHFWTSGKFSADAESFLVNASQNSTGAKISWLSGKQLLLESRRISKSVSDSFRDGFKIN